MKTIIEDGVIAGNVYPKYSTRNPIARYLFNGFLNSLDSMVAEIDPDKIFEVGCGEGYLISRFAKDGRILIGSDFSTQIIEEARKLAYNKDILFKTANIYKLNALSDSSPLILCCEVLEHLEFPEKAVDVLAELADPYLIASVPNEPIWRILNILRGNYLRDLGNTPGHLNHWSKRKYISLLKKKFNILRIETPLPWIMVLCQVRK